MGEGKLYGDVTPQTEELSEGAVPTIGEIKEGGIPFPKKPLGMLSDPTGDISSKRVQSFVALIYAMLLPPFAGIFGWGATLPIAELVVTFLVYSAAMQGISYINDKPLMKNGNENAGT
jgi:hypothetical protein